MDEADGYIPHQSGGGCDPIKYRYRFGLSILDLGGLRWHKLRETPLITKGAFDSQNVAF